MTLKDDTLASRSKSYFTAGKFEFFSAVFFLEDLHKRVVRQGFMIQKQSSRGAFENLGKFTGKKLCQSLFFSKVVGLGLRMKYKLCTVCTLFCKYIKRLIRTCWCNFLVFCIGYSNIFSTVGDMLTGLQFPAKVQSFFLKTGVSTASFRFTDLYFLLIITLLQIWGKARWRVSTITFQ